MMFMGLVMSFELKGRFWFELAYFYADEDGVESDRREGGGSRQERIRRVLREGIGPRVID